MSENKNAEITGYGRIPSITTQQEIEQLKAKITQQEIEQLKAKITQLQKELSECLPDTILLSYLTDLPNIPPGYGWKLYKSTTGRGWRLATIPSIIALPPGVYSTPREAIRAEINLEIQLEEKE